MTPIMRHHVQEFLEFAGGTRDDFHEPDEQEIEFVDCVGTILDNAMGTGINQKSLEEGYQEVVVFVKRRLCSDKDKGGFTKYYRFNLADLFALAHVGAEKLRTRV